MTNFLNFARPAQLTLSRVDLRRDLRARGRRNPRRTRARSAATSTSRGEFGAVEGDEVLLRQAFSNLLRNARRGLRRRVGRAA